jgi:3-hydroxymyristoyl/3-hydroxydecanoyl-(acyl carrier protein) dehydratase
LSETLAAIEAGLGARFMPFQITSAKFLRPTRPGDRVQIEFSRAARGEIRFTCTVEGRRVLTGQMTCNPPSTAR